MCSVVYQMAGLRVLVVDSHGDSLDLVKVLLESYHANVLAVNSVGQAVQCLQNYRPDILISEIVLPDEDGYALVKKIKQHSDSRQYQIPAIALTTQVSQDAVLRAFSAGFCRHISKPYEFETLLETIAQLAKTGMSGIKNCQHCI